MKLFKLIAISSIAFSISLTSAYATGSANKMVDLTFDKCGCPADMKVFVDAQTSGTQYKFQAKGKVFSDAAKVAACKNVAGAQKTFKEAEHQCKVAQNNSKCLSNFQSFYDLCKPE